MLKNKIKSRKSVQNRNSKKVNDRVQPSSIFELISQIPKEKNTLTVFSNHKMNLKYAEILLTFCESKLSDKLDLLDFDKSDTVGELLFSLTKLIVDNGFTIVYDYEEFKETKIVDFNYKDIKYEWHWYLMEAKQLHHIKSPELKIGYCHLMKRFGKQLETSFISHTYSDFNHSLFEYEAEYIETLFDDGDIECDCEDFKEYEQIALKPYVELKSEYDSIVNFPLDKFNSYKPKNKPERKLKELIEQGLKIDFSIIHRFPDNEIPFGEDGDLVSYTNSFLLVAEYTSELEQLMMEKFHNDANHNGVTYPVNYFRYDNGEIIDGPSIEEENEIDYLCKFLTNLSDYFY